MADSSIKQKIAANEFFVAPGVFDMMSVLMANRVGFECVYASGFWLTASYLGIPDAGIATYTDMLNRVARVVELSDAPVIADADTGFGGLLNIQQTVRGYEAAGVTGIQIEDQEFPKKCGHTPYRRVVPVADMLGRIQVALDARRSDDCLIIARTDARTGSGLGEALDRACRFAEVGADLIFVEALESKEELKEAAETVPGPLLANMADGGHTPILSASELHDLGYAGAIFPAAASLAANAAVEAAFEHLKATGTTQDSPVAKFDFPTFCREIGFEEVWEFEKKWAHLLEPKSDDEADG